MESTTMDRRISFFGGTTQGRITLEDGHVETRMIDRDVWFDRNFDGRWLVYAVTHGGASPEARDDQQVAQSS